VSGYPWMYFGCRAVGRKGHYLEIVRPRPLGFNYEQQRIFETFDGKLAPRILGQDPFETRNFYEAAITRFGGMGISALSWWDPSVDSRPGSNSIVFAPSPSASPETIYRGFARFFPQVEGRFRRVLVEDSLGLGPDSDRLVADRRVWIPGSVSSEKGRTYFRDEDNNLRT
jgi:hypothetical protein